MFLAQSPSNSGGGTIQYKGYIESALKVAKENTLPELWEICTNRKSEDAEYMVAQGAINFVIEQEELKLLNNQAGL
ncbi:hypothetical protein QT711_11685 [Sporosarcina saromensis]|uniref:Uncharacterized protein n=1 Tax=Sporosarcina saromensis TaxID=359365 RepID=A0ABU4GA62_9BACL|nr:hypothetical protein [Sporosarcina saromensis]MDW0113850.1 hypothetical protein [Sporosarcina saromensis]